MIKTFKHFLICIPIVAMLSCKGEATQQATSKPLDFNVKIPVGGNTWIVNDWKHNRGTVKDEGIRNWTDKSDVLRSYFSTTKGGELALGLNLAVPQGETTLKVTVGNTSKEIKVNNGEPMDIPVGRFPIESSGYHFVEIQALETTAKEGMANIDHVLLGGEPTEDSLTYVKDDFYWGRRGPSVHLSYQTPKDKDILWFYNEITVPEGQDVIGSYFMANGFAEGYFGIQVNSPTERRILFSVWSPYQTQDPNEIPEDYKIIMLDKGPDVNVGEFGNEGSGGQSYRVFNWKAGKTYGFLLKGQPSVNNSTDYTAYFHDPETGRWDMIASFRRPYTSTYIKRPHSFLENFVTHTGYMSRMAHYGNQWAQDTDGKWHELTTAKFTADATARKGARIDYAGGAEGQEFFMKNCGFFSGNTPIDSKHQREASGKEPQIDLSSLRGEP